jgi:trigger factor
MHIAIENTGSLTRRMTIGISKEHLEPKIKEKIKSLARTAKVNGFRPGKVPFRVIEQKYGPQVRQEILGEVVQKSFYDAVEEKNLRPIGKPDFDFQTDINKLEQGLSYTATFEIYPEIPSLQVEGLAIEKPVAEVTEEDVDTMLTRLRQQRQTWNEIERAAQEGDRVTIDFVGAINGAPFKGHEAKQLPIILGQKNIFLPGLEEKLVGSYPSQDIQVDLYFPADYPNLELANQTVHFDIHVHSIAEPQLPELDANFAKSFGVEDGNLDTLRQDARQNMERELEYAIKGFVKQRLLDALLNANPLEVPQSLVEEEAQRLTEMRQQNWQTQQLSTEMFKEEATKRVKLGLLVNELVTQHQIQVHPELVQKMIHTIASAYEAPEAVVRGYYADKQRLKEIESMVLEDQVVEWLFQKGKITEIKSDFYTIMEKNRGLSEQQVLS